MLDKTFHDPNQGWRVECSNCSLKSSKVWCHLEVVGYYGSIKTKKIS